ncbi:hypothetical protein BH18ACI4_BH18ACI4_11640 [soil metagenome]
MISPKTTHWRFGVFVGLAVMVVTFIPQMNLLIRRGADWQGSYALIDYDELTYSTYLQSLIQGRPRRNNPYSGTEQGGENYYSIQFLPPYAIALSSRVLRISASTAFILLLPLTAFASSLAIFWLLSEVTGNYRAGAVGVLIVLLCGRLVSESPFVAMQSYGAFAFLRRYIPAVPFPLFFIFCVFIWRAFTRQSKLALVWSLAAGITLGLLVYSYFYLWTAAAAWFLCFSLLWFVARPGQRAHVGICTSIVAAISLCALFPYFYLLTLRAKAIDSTQALVFTHAPDFFRITEITGAFVLIALAWCARRGTVDWRSPRALFAASCAAAPFVVFNQQICTGRSLQPFHYEQFVINYLLLVGLVITYNLIWLKLRIRPVMWAVMALAVGLATAFTDVRKISEVNILHDESIPVFRRLQSEAKESSAKDSTKQFALFDHYLLSASAPTSSSIPALWSHYMYTFGSTSEAENRERFYQTLYYLGVDRQSFENMLNGDGQVRAIIFGFPRVNDKLMQDAKPISTEEIRDQVQRYSDYIASFSAEKTQHWPLSHVILMNDATYDLTNLDRWYERDGGERIGGATLYHVSERHKSVH